MMRKGLVLSLGIILGGYLGMGYMDHYEHVKKIEFLRELILQDKLIIETKDYHDGSKMDSKLAL